MKNAVAAANGRVAQKVVQEAQARGIDVTAFGRSGENKSGAAKYIQKDIMELTRADLAWWTRSKRAIISSSGSAL